MSRTIRMCPRRYQKVADGKTWNKCKCAWCMNLDRERLVEKIAIQEMNEAILDEYGGSYTPWAWEKLWMDYHESNEQSLEEWQYWEEYQQKLAA